MCDERKLFIFVKQLLFSVICHGINIRYVVLGYDVLRRVAVGYVGLWLDRVW